MAAPTMPGSIGIKVAGANAGEYVVVRNNTRGGQLTGKINSAKEVILNPASSDLDWRDGDDLVIEMSGANKGSTTAKLNGTKGVSVQLAVSADTTTPGVTL